MNEENNPSTNLNHSEEINAESVTAEGLAGETEETLPNDVVGKQSPQTDGSEGTVNVDNGNGVENSNSGDANEETAAENVNANLADTNGDPERGKPLDESDAQTGQFPTDQNAAPWEGEIVDVEVESISQQPDQLPTPGENAYGEPVSVKTVIAPPLSPPPASAVAEETPIPVNHPTPPAAPPLTVEKSDPKKDKSVSSARSVVATSALTALLVGTLAGGGGYLLGKTYDKNSETVNTTVKETITELVPVPSDKLSPRLDNSIAVIAEKVAPSVVSVEVTNGSATSGGSGSGFILQPGYVVTNNHVVSPRTGNVEGISENAKITISFKDRSSAEATVVGTSSDYDLAVLKVDTKNLPNLKVGNSDNVVVGDGVVAIGSPLGLDGTVTSGIVSSLNRPVYTGDTTTSEVSFINAIQTDAAINPGNSGGPLVNLAGEVVGVNSAIASLLQNSTSPFSPEGNVGSIGLGFATPSNTMVRVVEEIIETGKANTPVLGVTLESNPGKNIPTVAQLTPNGAAEKAGIAVGDEIVSIDGKRVFSNVELVTTLRTYAPGDTVEVGVRDKSGKVEEIPVTLGILNNQP